MTKVAVAGAIGFGALATGLIASRKGRNLLREAWQGRRRSTLEDRILEALWSRPSLARERVDVEEVLPGVVVVTGAVADPETRTRVVGLVREVPGVEEVEDRILVRPEPARR